MGDKTSYTVQHIKHVELGLVQTSFIVYTCTVQHLVTANCIKHNNVINIFDNHDYCHHCCPGNLSGIRLTHGFWCVPNLDATVYLTTCCRLVYCIKTIYWKDDNLDVI